MTELLLATTIHASVQTCFDLARSIDTHLQSTARTKEKVVAGRKSGLCELHDEMTWEAVHFGIRQRLSSRITRMEKPFFFEDTMLKGAFKSLRHEHYFEEKNGMTEMRDVFRYEVPYGIFGKFFNWLLLKKYLARFIAERNAVIKKLAEEKMIG
jgi:ligand-binding SRPBCC domain-containing protein